MLINTTKEALPQGKGLVHKTSCIGHISNALNLAVLYYIAAELAYIKFQQLYEIYSIAI